MANVVEHKLVKDPRLAARRSTVFYKYLMAATGLIMIGYLLLHMYGNLKVFEGQEKYDAYGEYLRTILEPILPRGGLLYIIRFVLLASVLLHAYAAVKLTQRDRAAAGRVGGAGSSRYESKQNRRGVQRSYASFTLRWGGVVIALFIVYHLLHLSANNTFSPGGASQSSYVRLVNGFEIWWVVVGYTVALIAIAFHLRHGIWSAATTLGANTSPARRRALNLSATVLALVISIGFLVPPYSVLFGLVD